MLSDIFRAEPGSLILSMVGLQRFSPPTSQFQLLIRSFNILLQFFTCKIDVLVLQEVTTISIWIAYTNTGERL